MPEQADVFTTGGMVGAWLPAELRTTFFRHVGRKQGAAGKFAVAAIEEKLRREGAFKDEPAARAVEIVKALPPEALPLLGEFAELLAVQGVDGLKARLDELRTQFALAAAAEAPVR